ncbi:MAG TPA: primosomal replication protein N [Alcanivoracaceae bacterium]|nr:primosomal replication protein N [Alcanivoracaceae bacterium]
MTLTGIVTACDALSNTPAGIPRQRLWLEHRSRQEELGKPREVHVHIALLFIGEQWVAQSQQLQVGAAVQVSGFLARSGYKGEAQQRMQLHVQQLTHLQS